MTTRDSITVDLDRNAVEVATGYGGVGVFLTVGDRHQPLANAWANHRKANGERALSVAEAAMNHRGMG